MSKVKAAPAKRSTIKREPRLSVKKRKFVVSKMKEEIARERQRAARGTKKLINRLTSNYRKDVFKTLRNKEVGAEEMVKAIIDIRQSFKNGVGTVIRDAENRDRVLLSPEREDMKCETTDGELTDGQDE